MSRDGEPRNYIETLSKPRLPRTRMNADNRLSVALRQGDLEAAKAALDSHADPNIFVDGFPALCTAAGRGATTLVNLLLSQGADPNITDCDGRTAVMWVAMNDTDNAMTVLGALHAARAALDAKDREGRTALDIAATTFNRAVLDWLHQHHASGTHANLELAKRSRRDGNTPKLS